MSQQHINIGASANDGNGDPLRTAFDKTEDNFTELYSLVGTGGVQSVSGDGVDNTDPDNPVLSFPTTTDIGAENASNKATTLATMNDTLYPSNDALFGERDVTGADSIVQADNGTVIYFNSASPFNFTIDQLTTKSKVTFINIGSATVTFVNGSGVTYSGVSSLSGGSNATAIIVYKTATTPIIISGSGGFTNPMTTAGDIIYGGASGVATRLAAGAAHSVLGMNAGATAPEYKVVSNGLTAGTNTFKWGGALTAATSITGAFALDFTQNTNAALLIDGAWTSTGNNQYHARRSGTFTARNTSSENLIGWSTNSTLIAGASSQNLFLEQFTPTFNVNSQTSIRFVGLRYAATITGTPTSHVALQIENGNVVIGSSTLQSGITGLQVNGTGTTSGLAFAVYNSTPSARFFVQENGISAHTTTFTTSATGQSGFGVNGTLTGRAGNADTFYNMLINAGQVFGANSQVAWAYAYIGAINDPSFSTTTAGGYLYNPSLTNAPDALYGFVSVPTTAYNGFGVSAPTALVHAGAVTTARASFCMSPGSTTTAPSSPVSGDMWHEGTGNRFMFRQGGASVEMIGTSSVNSVSPTAPNRTLTVLLNNTTYYIHAKTTND